MPLISIIVPVYNVESYIDRCIKSILSQTFQDYELIIVDDGSPDNCPKICDEWAIKDKRIKVIHQKNQGLSAARNTGIKFSEGKYLTFIDSDDWITDSMVQDLYDLIEKTEADISVCGFTKTESEENLVDSKRSVEEKIYTRDEFMKIILRVNSNRCIHYAWAKLYRRSVIETVEHYPVGMLNEDVEGMFKAVIKSNKIAETTKVGYFYYENIDSISRKKFGENFLSLNKVWKRILEISENIAPEYKEYVEYNYKRTDFTIMVDMLIYGDSNTDRLYEVELVEINNRLKGNMIYLLKSPMKVKRKIVMIGICYFYRPIRFIVRKIKRK